MLLRLKLFDIGLQSCKVAGFAKNDLRPLTTVPNFDIASNKGLPIISTREQFAVLFSLISRTLRLETRGEGGGGGYHSPCLVHFFFPFFLASSAPLPPLCPGNPFAPSQSPSAAHLEAPGNDRAGCHIPGAAH